MKPTVIITLEAEQDDFPVRGTFASGDAELDRQDEDAILERLDRGEVWAWANVFVRARFRGFQGLAVLGGCSYRDEKEFKQPGGYFDDMKDEALADLARNIHAAVERAEQAKRALHDLGTAQVEVAS